MSIFKDLVSIWNSEDLLSQAWDESREMMALSEDMFSSAIKYMRRGAKIKKLKKLKKEDKKINEFQQNVRKKVVTHFSVSKNVDSLPNGLVLLHMVIDVERLGDYTKNIYDLAVSYPKKLNAGTFEDKLTTIEHNTKDYFNRTIDTFKSQDIDSARELMGNYKEEISEVSQSIVEGVISGKDDSLSASQAASVVLYSRYLKRIAAHSRNLISSI